jgi:hypothetical protein
LFIIEYKIFAKIGISFFESIGIIKVSDELTLVVDYAPSSTGTSLEDLAVNLLTSVAAVTGAVYTEQGMAAPAAHALTQSLFAEHLKRPDTFHLATTRASDLTTAEAGSDRLDSQMVGLFHAGLSRLGAEVATSME